MWVVDEALLQIKAFLDIFLVYETHMLNHVWLYMYVWTDKKTFPKLCSSKKNLSLPIVLLKIITKFKHHIFCVICGRMLDAHYRISHTRVYV